MSTLNKINIMQAYVDGETVLVEEKDSDWKQLRSINIFGKACEMAWDWVKYDYSIVPRKEPFECLKYTNIRNGNAYNLYQTEKEAIFHSNPHYERSGVKVRLTEVLD